MQKTLLLTIILCCWFQLCISQPGKIDSSFGSKGFVTADPGTATFYPGTGIQSLLAPDGSIYLIGETGSNTDYHQTFVKKIGKDGKADAGYGFEGFSELLDVVAVKGIVQADGKIVLAGSNGDFILMRLDIHGTVDSTFGNKGKQVTDFNSRADYVASLALQSDGRIVVAGSSYINSLADFAVARYSSNGKPDKTFSTDGKVLTNLGSAAEYASSVAVQSDGKIVVAGSTQVYNNEGNVFTFAALVRYNVNGTPDSSFSGDGKQTTGVFEGNAYNDYTVTSLAIQRDGKLVIAGNRILRYNNNGTLDSTFSDDGIQPVHLGTTYSLASSIAIQSDQKIVIAGYTYAPADFAVARFNADGTPDHTFSEDGIQTTDFNARDNFAYSVAIQPDGKILVAGSDITMCPNDICLGQFALVRYDGDGTPDSTFDQDGKLTGNYPAGRFSSYTNLAVQKDGKVVVVGTALVSRDSTVYFTSRYNADGNLDKTFGIAGIQMNDIKANSVAIQNDGKIVIAGNVSNHTAFRRYDADGTTDSSYGSGGKLITTLLHLAPVPFVIQKNDQIVAVSVKTIFDAEGYADHPALDLLRYNKDGSLDSSLRYDGTSDRFLRDGGTPAAIGMQSDGKIVVAATSDGFRYRGFVLAIFNPDGTLAALNTSTVFRPSDEINENVRSMAIQADDKIILQGNVRFSTVLARFKPDAGADTSFGKDGKQIVITEIPGTFLNSATQASGGNKILDVQNDGKILLASNLAIIRCNADGSLDSSFSKDGLQKNIVGTIFGIAVENKKIYTAGYNSFKNVRSAVVARYILDTAGNSAPTVSLTTPVNKAAYLAGGNVYLTAAASDADGIISKVDFYADSTLLYTATDTPYTFKWQKVNVGNYTLTAKATDNSGLVSTSAPVLISVVKNKPPVVSIVTPANDRTYTAPANIHLEAVAQDIDGRVTTVQFYSDTTLLTLERILPYTYDWKNVPAGRYTITAVATDNWGAVTNSAPVRITVTPVNQLVNGRPGVMNNNTDLNRVSIRVSPNPANNVVNIYTSGLGKDNQTTVSVISFAGVIIYTKKINNSSQTLQLNITSLPAGVYTVKILNGGKVRYGKFVKM